MAKWAGSGSTRAKDSDRQDTCRILDNAFNDGEISSEEHRERIRSATNAVTLGELQRLVADLQSQGAAEKTPGPGTRVRWPNGLGLTVAALVVTVLLGIAIGWGLYGNTTSPLDFTSDPGAKSDGIAPVVLTPPKRLQSLGGLTGLLEQTRKRFGDTMGYRLLVYPEYASMDRSDPTDERRVLSYTYRGGWGDPSSSAKNASTQTTLVDLSKFDVKTVVGVLRGAPETVGIKQQDVKSSYLIVDPAKDPTTPGALSLSIYISSDYGSGSIELAPDGTPKQVRYVS